MSTVKPDEPDKTIELEYDIEEPPGKVWRAITVPELRDVWLPGDVLADTEAASLTPGEEVSYRIRESAPPFLESLVTFRIAPNAVGGTSLRIVHQCADAGVGPRKVVAANDDATPVMRAA